MLFSFDLQFQNDTNALADLSSQQSLPEIHDSTFSGVDELDSNFASGGCGVESSAAELRPSKSLSGEIERVILAL